jgi:hypothetical protein
MPGTSRESAELEDHGPVQDRHAEVDGYTINFVTLATEMDGTPLLKGAVDDRCQCPHWGYVFKGSVTFRFADHDEVYDAGDAFYVPPGHAPLSGPDTEYLQFSPTEELKQTAEVMLRNMQAAQAG